MAVIPIPSDWDGETWECFSVQWPDSQLYRGLLLGQLTALTRGRFWDERSGSIIDAQQVGLEIQARNIDLEKVLMTCNEDALSILTDLTNAVLTTGGGGVCCPGGTVPGREAGTEGGIPPIGYQDTTETGSDYSDRKCAVANLVQDQIEQIVQKFIDTGLDDTAQGLGLAGLLTITTLAGAAIGEIITPVPLLDGLIGATIGFMSGLATAMILNVIDLDALILDLQTNRQDYVCVLFNSTDADLAISDYLTELSNNGVSTANIAFMGALLAVDYINALYFAPDAVEGQLQAALQTYVPPTDCSLCGCFDPWPEIGTIVDQGLNWVEVQTGPAFGPCDYLSAHFRFNPASRTACCKTIVDASLVSGTWSAPDDGSCPASWGTFKVFIYEDCDIPWQSYREFSDIIGKDASHIEFKNDLDNGNAVFRLEVA